MSSVAIVRAPDRHYADTGLVATVEPAPMDRPIVVLQTERALDRPTQVTTRHTVRYAVGMAQLSINAVATFVVVVVLGLAALTLLPQLAGYRSVVVASGSMEPSLSVADIVVTRPADDILPVGAVIEFEVDGASRIHRIVEVVPGGYRTKGDANGSVDSATVSWDAIGGYGLMVVPVAGLPSWLASVGRWVELTGLVVTLVVAGVLASPSWMSWAQEGPRKQRARWHRIR